MFRRLHSKMIGMGCLCGLPPSPPAEVFLKTLPPPEEVNIKKYRRFKQEESDLLKSSKHTYTNHKNGEIEGEPFFKFITGASGHKHCVLLTDEGNMVTFGDNRFGQTGAPLEDDKTFQGRGKTRGETDWAPLYVDLAGMFQEDPTKAKRVVCGTNFSLVYQQGTRRAIGFGNNHLGQLGAGGKKAVEDSVGFLSWDPLAPWWPSAHEGASAAMIEEIVSGYNHSIVRLTDGSLFSFGSNTWGELGIGTTVSPMMPTAIAFFQQQNKSVKKVAAGNSFSLFLTVDGRVYGCGATNYGQLPPNTFEPTPIPLTRSFQNNFKGELKSKEKLIRIKDIACVGSMSVYVSEKNEILFQGSFPDFGVHVTSPNFNVLSQDSVKEAFATLSDGKFTSEDGFDIRQVIGTASNLFVLYRNGCVAGMGANAEGQLKCTMKNFNGKWVNVAPTFTATELFPIFVPRQADKPIENSWFTAGKGFTLLVDNDEAYDVRETTRPIELPPGTNNTVQSEKRRGSLMKALK